MINKSLPSAVVEAGTRAEKKNEEKRARRETEALRSVATPAIRAGPARPIPGSGERKQNAGHVAPFAARSAHLNFERDPPPISRKATRRARSAGTRSPRSRAGESVGRRRKSGAHVRHGNRSQSRRNEPPPPCVPGVSPATSDNWRPGHPRSRTGVYYLVLMDSRITESDRERDVPARMAGAFLRRVSATCGRNPALPLPGPTLVFHLSRLLRRAWPAPQVRDPRAYYQNPAAESISFAEHLRHGCKPALSADKWPRIR